MAAGNFGVSPSLERQLSELMKLEIKQHTATYFPYKNKAIGDITRAIRDKAARDTRLILHIFDLPSEIFITSVIIVDRYISSKQVKANQINIISLSSLHLACSLATNMCQETQIKIPSKKDLIPFLGRQFKESDFDQMKEIISKEICSELPNVLTPLTFKKLFDEVMASVAVRYNLLHIYKTIAGNFNTGKAMEIVACDSDCMTYFAREIALCILYVELNKGLLQIKSVGTAEMYTTAKQLRTGIGLLQAICKITNDRFLHCFSAVNLALIIYAKNTLRASRKLLAPRTSVTKIIRKFELLTTVSETDELNEI